MAQIVNTNLPSLNAQKNLDTSSSGLAVSLQRLSSGLRINSSKDDAAGLAISTRFTSSIQGLSQAGRNANDAISLAQVAEGALQEGTRLLQRARELAIQSANGTNSATDRQALQAEVNQLKQELQRIAETTTFNGLKILNGELSNTAFQIGSEANQTVSVSISDTRTTALGTNTVTSDNTDGIQQATYKNFIGGGSAGTGGAIGTLTGVTSAAATNGYTSETFTVTNINSAGVVNTQTFSFSNNDDAATIASNFAAGVTGVKARGYNEVSLSSLTAGGADTDSNAMSLVFSGSFATGDGNISISVLDGATALSLSDIATAINAQTDCAAAGIYAKYTGTAVNIYLTEGQDVIINNGASAGASTITVTSALDGNAGTATASGASQTRGGRVDVTLNQDYTLKSTDTGIFGGTANTVLSATKVGSKDVTSGNSVDTQTLTISGGSGSATVSVAAQDTAATIVTKVNAKSGTTNVSATATTQARLSSLSANGTVSFNLYGNNSTAALISASITTNDFTPLMTAINNAAGNTGITATTDGANNVLLLTNSNGNDIKIEGFTHSAAVNYQLAKTDSTTILSGDGSSLIDAVVATMSVVGNPNGDIGATVQLTDGGTTGLSGTEDRTQTNQNSVVIGGQVKFLSSSSFSVSSSVNGTTDDYAYRGSLFDGGPNSSNQSTQSTVNQVDISTVTGAQSAISVVDAALGQLSSVRASLGAVQSRFESATRNIANSVENLSGARSRILDADFAAETASLTKNQILTQAGVAILAQANALPQNILGLLRG